MAIHITRAKLNQDIFLISKKLSNPEEERAAFENAARNLFNDLPEEISIKALTDEQAKVIYQALRACESALKSKSSFTPASTVKLATDAQIRAVQKILRDRYENDYEAITKALRNYAGGTVARLKIAADKNIYLPNFFKIISFAEADALIKRFDAIRAGQSKIKNSKL